VMADDDLFGIKQEHRFVDLGVLSNPNPELLKLGNCVVHDWLAFSRTISSRISETQVSSGILFDENRTRYSCSTARMRTKCWRESHFWQFRIDVASETSSGERPSAFAMVTQSRSFILSLLPDNLNMSRVGHRQFSSRPLKLASPV